MFGGVPFLSHDELCARPGWFGHDKGGTAGHDFDWSCRITKEAESHG
jgi:hypothetical protein